MARKRKPKQWQVQNKQPKAVPKPDQGMKQFSKFCILLGSKLAYTNHLTAIAVLALSEATGRTRDECRDFLVDRAWEVTNDLDEEKQQFWVLEAVKEIREFCLLEDDDRPSDTED